MYAEYCPVCGKETVVRSYIQGYNQQTGLVTGRRYVTECPDDSYISEHYSKAGSEEHPVIDLYPWVQRLVFVGIIVFFFLVALNAPYR